MTVKLGTSYKKLVEDINTDISKKANTSDIPTLTSQLENDSGFVTNSQIEQTFVKKDELSLVATSGNYEDLVNKPDPYTLPVASTTSLGGVKVDGSTISISDEGVISSIGGGSGSVDSVNGQTGVVVIDSSDIKYTDSLTIQQALDQLLYVAPSITSFTGGGTYEIGQTINTVNLSWNINKSVISQSINNGIGSIDPSLRTYVVSNANLTSNTTYTLTVNDGQQSASRSTSVNFRYRRYWGVNASQTITNEQILQLSSEFATNRQQTRTFDCSGGKYFYLVIPTSFCSGISFKVGGLSFSDMNVQTIQFTNASGNTSSYNVYRPNNIQTGSAISVEVL